MGVQRTWCISYHSWLACITLETLLLLKNGRYCVKMSSLLPFEPIEIKCLQATTFQSSYWPDGIGVWIVSCVFWCEIFVWFLEIKTGPIKTIFVNGVDSHPHNTNSKEIKMSNRDVSMSQVTNQTNHQEKKRKVQRQFHECGKKKKHHLHVVLYFSLTAQTIVLYFCFVFIIFIC